jgi:NAD(P)-dependent dehydrogenase (short-subunit alcohol dehydrogenase family)
VDLGIRDFVVLITGGSDGLGAAAASALLEEGARVAICARDRGRLEDRAAQLRQKGGDVLAVVADVTDRRAVREFVAQAHSRWGRIDGLINNAGTSAGGSFDSITEEQWNADLELKLTAATRLARLVHEHMKPRGGSIVNVLNTMAKAPRAFSMPTSVSRAAGLAFTKALSKEWAVDQIRVNAILIGIVESGQWVRRAAAASVEPDDYYRKMAQERGIPLGRVGRAEEFGALAAFLISPRSGYITGTAINLDGGESPVA